MKENEAEKTIDVPESDFTCKKCGCISKIKSVKILKREVVKNDFSNDCAIGNARIDCLVCGEPKYFWKYD